GVGNRLCSPTWIHSTSAYNADDLLPNRWCATCARRSNFLCYEEQLIADKGPKWWFWQVRFRRERHLYIARAQCRSESHSSQVGAQCRSRVHKAPERCTDSETGSPCTDKCVKYVIATNPPIRLVCLERHSDHQCTNMSSGSYCCCINES